MADRPTAVFHAKDGWHFQRTPDGGVAITLVGPLPCAETMARVILDADTWCSVVASVTAAGETAETFRRAAILHAYEEAEWQWR